MPRMTNDFPGPSEPLAAHRPTPRKATTKVLWWWRILMVAAFCISGFGSRIAAQEQPQLDPPKPSDSPSVTTAEVLFGSDRLDFKGVVLKSFAPQSRFDFLSVTVAQGEQNNSSTGFDFVNVTNVNYDFYKGIGVNVGITFDRSVGFNTTLGLQYAYSAHGFNLVWDPSFFPNGTHDVQNYLETDYRPTVVRNWKLYENLQIFDDYNPKDGVDERRFVHVRTGAQYKRFGFGFGFDADWYGTPPSSRRNYGPVLGYSF